MFLSAVETFIDNVPVICRHVCIAAPRVVVVVPRAALGKNTALLHVNRNVYRIGLLMHSLISIFHVIYKQFL